MKCIIKEKIDSEDIITFIIFSQFNVSYTS